VLLTRPNETPEPFEQALQELDPSNLVLLGGESAISPQVEASLADDHRVVRVAGADRYETAAEIARHTGGPAENGLALLSSGQDFPDALTAGAVAAGEDVPLLLTAQSRLPQSTREALQDLDVEEVVLTGGPAAVSAEVAERVKDLGIDVTRVAGENRFATARAIGDFARDRFGWRTENINLTNGQRFPDAVALAAHAGLEAGGPAPIALTTAEGVPGPTQQWLSDLAACDFTRTDIAGGTAAVSEGAKQAALDALDPGGCDDGEAPELNFTDPEEGATVLREQDGVELSGTTRDDTTGVRKVEIYVDDQRVAATAGDRGSGEPLEWSVTVTPPETTTFTFEAVATDGAGNTGRDTLTVTVEGRDPGETVVDKDVQVLGDNVVDYDPDAGTIVVAGQPADDPLEAGDTVVSGTSSAAPDGFLRNVITARHHEQGQVALETEPGHLTEVFRQVDTRLHRPVDLSEHLDEDQSDGVTLVRSEGLPPGDETKQDVTERPRSEFPRVDGASTAAASQASASRLFSAAPARLHLAKSIQKTWTLSFDQTVGDNPSLTVQGQNEFTVGVSFRVKVHTNWDWFNSTVRLERLRLAGAMTEVMEVSAVARAGVDLKENVSLKSIPLGAINFQIGPVPVVLTSTLDFELRLSANAQARATTGVSGRIELEAGTEFRHEEGWQPINRFDHEWNFDPLEVDGEATARAGLEAGLDVKLWDTGGTEIGAGPYVRFAAGPSRDPRWDLFWGLEGTAQLTAQVPIIDVEFETDEKTLFTHENALASARDYPPPPPDEPEPPAVAITSPSQDSVGCCEVLLRADTDSPHREDDEHMSVDYRSDRDGELGTGFGQDPLRVTLSPETHTITAEVTDFADDGEQVTEVTATDQITVDVAESRRPSEQFHVRETVGAGGFPAGLLALVLKNDEDVFFDGAEFLSAPPSDGFAGTVENVPGGVEGKAVMLSTGKVEDADTANEADEAGADLGGGAVRGDSDRDVIVWALHLSIPEHVNCLTFDHRFLSEEVPRFVGSEYNDAFVAELFDRIESGSQVPGSGWNTSGSELSAPESFAAGPGDFKTQVNASTGIYVTPSNAFQTTHQSGHPQMRAATPVTPGSDKTLALSLFDQGDASYDSAVILDNLRLLQVPDPATDCTSGLAPGGLTLTTSG
jgi:hypothetical protein